MLKTLYLYLNERNRKKSGTNHIAEFRSDGIWGWELVSEFTKHIQDIMVYYAGWERKFAIERLSFKDHYRNVDELLQYTIDRFAEALTTFFESEGADE